MQLKKTKINRGSYGKKGKTTKTQTKKEWEYVKKDRGGKSKNFQLAKDGTI